MPTDDVLVIRAVLAGDVDRYAQLVDKYQGQVLRVAFSLLGNYEDAKDASQEAFVSAYQALPRFQHTAKFSTWLYRIVVNKCKDAWKRRARHPVVVLGSAGMAAGDDDPSLFDVEDPSGTPSDQATNRELAEQLTRAIQQLPDTQKTAFLLHHVHGCSLEEVADVMGCRVGTVKSHMFRATQRLQRQLPSRITQEA